MLGGILSILAAIMPAPGAGADRSGVPAVFVFAGDFGFAFGAFVSDFRFPLGAFARDFGFLFGAFARRFPFVFCAIRSA